MLLNGNKYPQHTSKLLFCLVLALLVGSGSPLFLAAAREKAAACDRAGAIGMGQ